MARPRTQASFRDVLPQLLQERGVSLRELSRRLEMDPTHLSRIRRARKRLPDDLPRRVAVALGLPEDYFPETREAFILEAIRREPDLLERIYRTISRAKSGPSSGV